MKLKEIVFTLTAAAQPALAIPGPAAAADTSTPPSATRILPFGEPTVIRTAVLRATAVILRPDEELRSITQPDGERWQVDWSAYGPDGATTPVVTVTPTDCGLTTNLLVLTTRRVYPLLFHAPPCELAANDYDPDLPFDAVVRFRYPAAELTAELARPAAPESSEPEPGLALGAPLEDLLERASRYSWRRKKRYRGPVPAFITDDGTSTYLVFPEGAFRGRDLPLFFLVDEEGERELANFDVEGSTFIVRTLFGRAALVLGGASKRRQPHLLITRRP